MADVVYRDICREHDRLTPAIKEKIKNSTTARISMAVVVASRLCGFWSVEGFRHGRVQYAICSCAIFRMVSRRNVPVAPIPACQRERRDEIVHKAHTPLLLAGQAVVR